MFLVMVAATASATDVLWVGDVPPNAADLAARIGADPEPLSIGALRAAVHQLTEADAAAIDGLERALETARPLEAQLDGELSILALLEDAVAKVTILRNESDASTLFRTLAYQGFAANRFYGGELSSDPDAAPWRASIPIGEVERPWLDAVAVAPGREASAYDIAEAPQRVAFNQLRGRILEVAPAVVALPDLPPGAEITVDGRSQPAGSSLSLVPGRHLVHAQWGDHVIERWDLRVSSAERRQLDAAVDHGAFDAFFRTAGAGSPVPESVVALLDAHGPVLLGVTDERGRTTFLDPSSGVLTPRAAPRVATGGSARVELHGGLSTGWFTSADFYLQDPASAPATYRTVNAISLGAYASGELVVGPAHLGVGVDLLAPIGRSHVALTGNGSTRIRAVPHVAVGVSWLQATAGFLFPYHPAIGGRARAPLGGPLEAHLSAWWGPPLTRVRSDGSIWDGSAVVSIAGGIGARFGNTER